MSTLKTRRIILCPLHEVAESTIYKYLKEPSEDCFEFKTQRSLQEAVREMKRLSAERECFFAIVLKEEDKMIGEIVAYPDWEDPEKGEASFRDTVSSYWLLSENYRGNGYAFEAACAFFDYLFSKKGVRRINVYISDNNSSSQRLCERLGMRNEGKIIEFTSFADNPDGTQLYENTLQYTILKKEWEANNNETARTCEPYLPWD